MITATKRLSFCCAHRLLGHEDKCANLHGHNYRVEIDCCTGDSLDSIGRIIDFSVIKERLGGWLDRNWDHAVLLNEIDPLVSILKQTKQIVAVMKGNPTAENMASVLFGVADDLFPGKCVSRVRVEETDGAWAEASA